MKPRPARRDQAKGISSLEIGYRVLLAVQQGPGSVQLNHIAARAGLSTGAAHNYMVSLVRTGLVEQESRGRYRLGPSAFALSLSSFEQLTGYDAMRAEASVLHRITGQSTALSVWSQGGPVSVFIQRSGALDELNLRPGHLPMTQSAAGLVYAAYLPEEKTCGIIEDELAAANSASTAKEFIAQTRDQVLAEGVAVVDMRDGYPFAMAAPVITRSDEIACVFSILGESAALPARQLEWRNALSNCAERAALIITNMPVTGPKIRPAS